MTQSSENPVGQDDSLPGEFPTAAQYDVCRRLLLLLSQALLGFDRRGLFRSGGRPLLRRQHPDDRHHSVIFVIENMAMIDEITDIRSSEVHPQSHVRIGTSASPIGHIDRADHVAAGLSRCAP